MSRCGFLLFASTLAVVAGLPARAQPIEMRPVADAGNVADTRYVPTGVGAVAHRYAIGRFEVTNAQYRECLNAKAAVGDPYGLYSDSMAGTYGGIARSGSGSVSDPWVYASKNGDQAWDVRPVNFVNFWDAARYCNWRHHGGGTGDTESGSYEHVGDQVAFARTATATWVIPNDDEWYKAAYYQGGGTSSGYWDYATRSYALPGNPPPSGDTGNSANYLFAVGGPYWSTAVGAYALSVGPYGTCDQNGNVLEWVEDVTLNPSSRGVRGGSWGSNGEYGLHAAEIEALAPAMHFNNVGFRVTLVPEPASLLALALLLSGRHRR